MRYVHRILAPVLLLTIVFFLFSCGSKLPVKGSGEKDYYLKTAVSSEKEKKIHKILIVPFEYRTGQEEFPNNNLIKTIIFTSFYSFFSFIPAIDLPDKSILTNIVISNENLTDIADQYQCEFIVFGDYELKGNKESPATYVNLRIWSKISHTVLTNSLTTPTDSNLFDAVDKMSAQITKTILNEEMKLAHININILKIAGENLELTINNRPVAKLPETAFSLSLKILADADYTVSVRNIDNNKNIFNADVLLKPGKSTNITIDKYLIDEIEVRSSDNNGTRYTAKTAGSYQFVITGGAYTAAVNAGKYRTDVLIYQNKSIVWNVSDNPAGWDYIIGYDTPFSTAKEAEKLALGNSIKFNLDKDDYLIFVIRDNRNFFSDNYGLVRLSVYKMLN